MFISVSENLSIAQSHEFLNRQEIDSLLNLQIQDTSKVDTLLSLGGYAKQYKKLLGFINIRTGTGYSNKCEVISNNNLFSYSSFFKKVTKKRYKTSIDEYFYVNNKLYKYVIIELLRVSSSSIIRIFTMFNFSLDL